MKKCTFCAEEIQDAAVVCKHCGRDLAKAEAPAVVKLTGRNRVLAIFLFSLIGLVIIGLALAPRPPAAPSKTLAVSVSWNSLLLQVTNISDAAAAGNEMTVYINGTPPFTYRATATVPAVGESVQLPLSEFATKGGDRFNPIAKAVTIAWVGGGGYDYASFKK
jgi:hypothetical protein